MISHNSRKTVPTPRASSLTASPTRMRRTGIWTTQLLIFGALFFALAVCVAHHVLFTILNGKDVEVFAISQTRIRDIGNTLAKIVQFLLKTCVEIVLTQSIWLYVRENRVTMDDLDTLFSLPSFRSLPIPILFKKRVLLTLLLAVMMETLPIVGILAPNALSVVPADSILRVPAPALDRIPATTSANFTQSGSGFLYADSSSTFIELARNALQNSTIVSWIPPTGCGLMCSYDVHYWGPALICSDIPQSSIGVFDANWTYFNGANATIDPSIEVSNPTHFLGGGYLYNATSSFGYDLPDVSTDSLTSPQAYAFDRPFSLDVVYATNNFILPFTPNAPVYYNMTGYSCTFHNATYTATINYLNGSQTATARVVEYGPQLGPISDPGNVGASDVHGSNADFLATYAALGLADAMMQYLYGLIAFGDKNYGGITATMNTRVESSFLAVNTEPTERGSWITSLSLASPSYDNLGQILEAACTNVTASLMSITTNLGLDVQVSASVTPATNSYKYQASRLWLVYGIALCAAFLAVLYGLVCIRKNGGVMKRTFSSIAASVRDQGLDTLLHEPGAALPDGVEKVKLRYRAAGSLQKERAGFVIADDTNGGGNIVEMTKSVTLIYEEWRPENDMASTYGYRPKHT